MSEGTPDAPVSLALLIDGSLVVCWKEGEKLLLRRVSAQGDLGSVAQVAESLTPVDALQLTVLADHDDAAPIRLALAYNSAGHAFTSAVSLPPLKELAAKDSACACANGTNQLQRGFEVHGTIVTVDAAAGSVTVKHDAIPGVMTAMTMPLKADEATLKALQPGQEFLGRMDSRDAEWWLFNVRVLVEPAK